MKLSKKSLIYPLAITSLYFSSTEAYSQNFGGFVANYAVGNYTGGHEHKCRHHRNDNVHLNTAQVKNQIDSLEKLMLNKSEYCLSNPYKKHKCDGAVHLNIDEVKSQRDSLEKLMANKEQFYNEPNKGERFIDTAAGKIAAWGGIIGAGMVALTIIGGSITLTIKEWDKGDY